MQAPPAAGLIQTVSATLQSQSSYLILPQILPSKAHDEADKQTASNRVRRIIFDFILESLVHLICLGLHLMA